MASRESGLLLLLLFPPFFNFLVLSAVSVPGLAEKTSNPFNRSSFPADFIFGTSSSCYQYEGGAREGGKGPSIWDTYTHMHPERIEDGSNGDVADDSYHKYKEDVSIMKGLNMDAYRFSIAWTRILPNGSLSGGVNTEGVKYYKNLINELLSKGVQPFVTLFHWDTPQALEDKYGGFLSPHSVDDFRDYADVCFKLFGDCVKHWITFNEPSNYCSLGYGNGLLAPGRCSPWAGNCSAGESGREPYNVCHHQLLAHATAVKLYRDKYQASQNGKIGIVLSSHWFLPYSNSRSNDDAAQRSLDFMFGWLMDPLAHGDYPLIMREIVKDRLPKFTREQSELVKGSFDFIGLNYYSTQYAYSDHHSDSTNTSYTTDSQAKTTGFRNGIPIGPTTALSWLYIYPPGIRSILLYIKAKYNNPLIYITENGIDEYNNDTLPLQEALEDNKRVSSYDGHLRYVEKAIREGVRVKGFFAWSLLDNFEWSSGYTVRFGLTFVDYKNGQKRYPKKSAVWFREFLKI